MGSIMYLIDLRIDLHTYVTKRGEKQVLTEAKWKKLECYLANYSTQFISIDYICI